jgi:hypothetical protein
MAFIFKIERAKIHKRHIQLNLYFILYFFVNQVRKNEYEGNSE